MEKVEFLAQLSFYNPHAYASARDHANSKHPKVRRVVTS